MSRELRTVNREPRTVYLAVFALVLAAVAAYHNSFPVPFIYDDEASIVDNPTIQHLGRALMPPPDATTAGRPVLNLTFALNYALGGLNVWGYHAFNLLIHTLAGLALFGLVRRTLLERPTSNTQYPTSKSIQPSKSKSKGLVSPKSIFGKDATVLALAVAVLWVVHPLQTESVTYVVQRAESLMGLFYLLTLYCFIRGVDGRRQESGDRSQEKQSEPWPSTRSSGLLNPGSWLLLSVVCCFLGMATKEVMVSAPLIVLLYDRTFVAGSFRDAWRRRRSFYLGLAAGWLLLGYLVASTGTRGGSAGFGRGISWWRYALTQFEAIADYLRLSFWPHPLIFDYGTAVIKNPAEAIPYALFIGLLAAATVVALWRRPAIAFAGVWFFAILAPSSSVVPVVTETMAEHRMYLPLAAVIALAVLGSYAWIGRRSLPVFLAAAVGLGFLTVRRNQEYRDPLAFWRELAALRPDNARAHNNLGLALASVPGQMPEAIAEFEAALQIDSNEVETHNNLGNAFMQTPGRLPEAIAQYEAALQIDPRHAKAHNNLGNALAQVPGRMPEAIEQYQAALRINPDFAEAHYNLAVALLKTPNRLPEAMAELEAVLRIKPDDAEAHNSLGLALSEIPGRASDAVAEYEAALRIDPDFAEAHYALGCALGGMPGRLSDAIAHFQAAVRIKPGFADAHYNLANTLVNMPGRLSEAISEYEAVVRIDPDDAEAQNNLACALSGAPGRWSDAIAHFQAAVRIKPDYAEAHKNLGLALSEVPGRGREAMAELETALQIDPSLEAARQKLATLRAAAEFNIQHPTSNTQRPTSNQP